MSLWSYYGHVKTCEEDQICTIHRVITFEQRPVKEKEVKYEFQKVEKAYITSPQGTRRQARLRSILS